MENLDNQELEPVVVPTSKKVKSPEPKCWDDLELQIINRSETLNIPALCAFFGVTEDVVRTALSKK
jgi:hypothetical protein